MRKLLLPLSFVYGLGVIVRNWFFDKGIIKSKKVRVPVIAVGNLSAGGTGKTPFVELLIETGSLSRPLAVVSRGYKRTSSGTVVVSDGRGTMASVEEAGDEPLQMAKKYNDLEVIVDENRVRGAEKAIELGARMIILDDGFQHRYLDRDLNIVLLTADELLKGDMLLPAGNMREPMSALKRADLIVITRCADLPEYEQVCMMGWERHLLPQETPTVGLKTILKAFRRLSSSEIVPADGMYNKSMVAFSGIGNPKSFEELLKKSGIKVVQHVMFLDHHWYTENDRNEIIKARNLAQAEFLVTTEKDAVRLKGLFDAEPVLVAEIQHGFVAGGEKFDEMLQQIHKS